MLLSPQNDARFAAEGTSFPDSKRFATAVPGSNFQIPIRRLISSDRTKKEGGAFNNEAKNLLIHCLVVRFSYFCQRSRYAGSVALQLERRTGDSRQPRSREFRD